MTEIRLLYITTKDVAQSKMIAEKLLEQKLIACANILPNMESIYHWNGKIQNDKESVLILKTETSLVEKATQAVLDLHSYDTPCVLSLSVESGSADYLRWLSESVKA